MKRPRLNDILRWRQRIYEVVGLSDGEHVHIRSIDNNKCPHCGGDIGPDHATMVTSAPIFQDEATPVQTLDHL